ncbi:MAG: phage portal protein family [Hyphomicrobiales bacterium]|nr:phage portal protein family [Hyphomicrobiales bacterium]
MNLWRKAAGLFRRPLSLTHPEVWRGTHEPSHSGESVNAHSVLGLSAAWACVNLLSGTISSLPLMVYTADRNRARTVARKHPLYRLLHDSPNFDQTAVDFWDFVASSLELWGNAYARIYRNGAKITSLEPIRPDIITVRRLKNGDIEYRWTHEGVSFVFTQNDVLHIRGFGGNPLGGLSTIGYGRNTFGLASAIERAAGTTFANGLRPSGTLTFEKWLTPEQRTTAEDKLVSKFVGSMNAGRPMVLEGGTKWEQLTINPEDAQMLQSRGLSVEEVCRFFGVPPFMVGHTEKTTSWGSGLEQQVLGFQKFTLRRRLKRIEQALEKQLLTPQDRADGITIEFSLEGLLRGDSAGRSAFYNAGLQNGWITINEVRALENMPPVEGGDIPRMQMQNVPITQAGQTPTLPAQGAQP